MEFRGLANVYNLFLSVCGLADLYCALGVPFTPKPTLGLEGKIIWFLLNDPHLLCGNLRLCKLKRMAV